MWSEVGQSKEDMSEFSKKKLDCSKKKRGTGWEN